MNSTSRTIQDIVLAVATGRRATDTRNALIAYGVAVEGIKQTTLAAATGVDKGDVSRVVKQANSNPDALAALKTLDRSGSPTKRAAAAAAVGEAFLRRPARPVPVGGKSGGKSTKSTAPAPVESNESTPVESTPTTARDILAALTVLRDAARTVKWSDDESADLSVIAMTLADISVA